MSAEAAAAARALFIYALLPDADADEPPPYVERRYAKRLMTRRALPTR